VSVMDHVLDTVSGVMQGSVAAVQGLIDRVRGNEPRRAAPTGSRQARRAATSVRGGSDVALERVTASVREAKATAQQVTREARSGATRTAKAARGVG
jgi:methyl-accepting chemotaxis protein